MHHTDRRLPSTTRWMAGALVALFPLTSFALGLGKLSVRSALNEPLNAEIEITSVSEKELKGLQVSLASRADFNQAGVERLAFLSQVKFTVSKRADGNYFVQLNTDRQIEEPFLHLLLAIEWPGGRMVREYTALIDPPVQVTGRPSGIEAPQATSSPAPVAVPAPVPEQPVPEPIAKEPVAKEEPKPEPSVTEQPAASQQPAATQQPKVEQPAPAPAAVVATEQKETAESRPAAVAATEQEETPEGRPAEVLAAPALPAEVAKRVVEPLAPSVSRQTGASVAAGWAQEGGYQVKWGDTAWRIAEELRADNRQTVEQLVLALYRSNPHAFFGNNVNNLKAGQILKVPENRDIESITPVQARTQMRAQYDAWHEYKLKLANASGTVKVVESASKPEAPAPVPKEAALAQKEPEKLARAAPAEKKTVQQQDEMLKIVRSTLQGEKATADKKPVEGETRKDVATKERQALSDRVATLEESLASRQMETKELGEKVAQVRAQLKREIRLLQIESKDLAAAQARAKAEVAKPAEPAPAPATKVEPAPAPVAKVESPKPVEQPAVERPKAEKPAPAPEKSAPSAAQKKPAPPAPTAVQEKGLLSEIIDSVLGGEMVTPIIMGAVVLLIGGIAMFYLNRRRKSIAEFEESILQSEGIGGASGEHGVTTDTSGQVVSTGDTSFLSDFSQGGMGNIHTDEVDPIAEAEVYLAYGRDETAEEILKEAIVKNPAREELKLKLLEIYANRNDVRAFETLAEEMYAAIGGRPSKHWSRVEELGRKLNPDNPMFRGGGTAPAAATAKAKAAAAPSFVDTAKMKSTETAPVTTSFVDTKTAVVPPVAPAAGDFDLDLSGTAAAAERGFDIDLGESATKTAAGAFDFGSDLGTGTAGTGMKAVEFNQSTRNVVEFDFGEKEEAALAGATTAEADVAQAAVAEAAPAVPAGEAGESPQWDETATKLDLARAYIDMGDSEGARSILQEVIAEGNEQQKKQAKELAAQIG